MYHEFNPQPGNLTKLSLGYKSGIEPIKERYNAIYAISLQFLFQDAQSRQNRKRKRNSWDCFPHCQPIATGSGCARLRDIKQHPEINISFSLGGKYEEKKPPVTEFFSTFDMV